MKSASSFPSAMPASHAASDAMRWSLPSFAALAIGVGAAVLALAQTVALPEFTPVIWLIFALSLAFAMLNRMVAMRALAEYNAIGRDAWWRRWALLQWLAWIIGLAVALLPPLTVLMGASLFVPPDAASDENLRFAVFVGWICIGVLFIAGASTGHRKPMLTNEGRSALAGEAPVPLAVPMLPVVPLFVLLNIISVETPVMVAMFVYIAATLYLASYENYFQRLFDAQSRNAPTLSTQGAPPAMLRRTVTQFITIAAFWMAIFGLAATAAYYPLTAALPRASIALDFNRNRYNERRKPRTDDWRSPGRSFSLRGGSYDLADTPAARVTLNSDTPSTLWRGRIYESYHSGADRDEGATMASRWDVITPPQRGFVELDEADSGAGFHILSTQRALLGRLNLDFLGDNAAIKTADVEARVQLLMEEEDGLSEVLLAVGRPVTASGSFTGVAVRTDGSARLRYQWRREEKTYSVRSQWPQPSLIALRRAPDLSPELLRRWRDNTTSAHTLELPRNPETRQQLQTLADEILQQAQQEGRPLNTPAAKADAIMRFLTERCEYSLSVPQIPPTADAAVFFMTDSKLGACDLFASSMALLLRTMNVPARIATGYRQPDTPDEAGRNVSGGTLTYTLRGKDAHAWVEYYVPTIGWTSADPTDGTRLADTSLTLQVGEMLQLTSDAKRQFALLFAAVLGVTIVGASWFFLRHRPHSLSTQDGEALRRARIAQAYEEARRLLAPQLKTSAALFTLTPQELENIVLAQPLSSAVKIEFAALTHLFQLSKYARELPGGSGEEGALRQSLQRLKAALKA